MYLSAREAAERKGVTPSAIYAAFVAGLLRCETVAGKRVTTDTWLEDYKPLARDAHKGQPLRRRRKAGAQDQAQENSG